MAVFTQKQRVALTILVAALGYFVDVFDLLLFTVLRVDSLKDLGLKPDEITDAGILLLNCQMAGMLLGGILWGVLGDMRGRIQVLFGSILLYSLGNIANAFVETVPAYAAARFFTGLGLAGEIGAGITLASELMPKATRNYATTIVGACGVVGAAAAAILGQALDWRSAYIGGGILGLLLLLLRVSVSESGMYENMRQKTNVVRGNFFMLFTNRKRLMRYLSCIVIAVPIWYVVGIIVTFSPEIGRQLDITEPLLASNSVIAYSIGIGLGGMISGLVSQFLASRKKALGVFILGTFITSAVILFAKGISAQTFYALLVVDGFFIGYWVIFIAAAAEQFGTNLRTTVTTTAANFVRGSTILVTLLVTYLEPMMGFVAGAQVAGLVCFVLAGLALWRLPETFARDLDFVER